MEKKTKHTPGPWTYGISADVCPHFFFHVGPDHKLQWHLESWGEIKANEADASLIAAAPDLLDALRGMAAGGCFCEIGIGHPSRTDHSDACKKAMAAIAKAEGK